MDAIRLVEAGQVKKDRDGFGAGDTVRVYVKVVEGEKERTQLFEGIVIRRRGESVRASFTVRRISYGVGVERTFPLHSPRIERVEVVRRSRVRRSKLYYLRGLAGKAARLKEKRAVLIPTTTEAEEVPTHRRDAAPAADPPGAKRPWEPGAGGGGGGGAASAAGRRPRDGTRPGADRGSPAAGSARHKGYATPEHLAALDRYGPCPIHRRSFAGVWRQGELFVLEEDD